MQPQAALPVAAAPPDATPPDATGSLGRWLRDLPACCHAVLLLAALQLALLAALGVIVLATGDASGAARLCAVALLLTSTWAFALGVAGVVLEHLEVQAAAVALAALAVVVGLAVPCATPACPPAARHAPARAPARPPPPPARQVGARRARCRAGCSRAAPPRCSPAARPAHHRRFSWRSPSGSAPTAAPPPRRAAPLAAALGRRPAAMPPPRHPRRRFSPQRRRRRRRGAPRGEHRWEGVVLPATKRASAGTPSPSEGCTRLRARRRRRRAARLRRRRRRRARNGHRRAAAPCRHRRLCRGAARRRRRRPWRRALCDRPRRRARRRRRRRPRRRRRTADADTADAAAAADADALLAGLDPLLQRLCSDPAVSSALRAMRVGCRVRLTTADATKHSAARDAWVQLSDDGTTVRWGWGAASIRLELLDALRWAMPGADSPPTAAPTDADARALAGGGDVTPRGSPRRSRTRDWHASLNALGEGADYSEPEPSPVPRIGCEPARRWRSRAAPAAPAATRASRHRRPWPLGRARHRAGDIWGWETPRPSCSPVLVERKAPPPRGADGDSTRACLLRRSCGQPRRGGVAPASRSSIAAAAEEESASSRLLTGKVSRTRCRRRPGDAPDNGVGEEEVHLARAARLVDALGRTTMESAVNVDPGGGFILARRAARFRRGAWPAVWRRRRRRIGGGRRLPTLWLVL